MQVDYSISVERYERLASTISPRVSGANPSRLLFTGGLCAFAPGPSIWQVCKVFDNKEVMATKKHLETIESSVLPFFHSQKEE